MKVNLLCHTPNPEKTIAAAARLCYSNSGADELFDGMTDEKASDYVAMLERLGHESPLEHVTFTFTIEGVSRAFLAQITRHRIASFSVQSQRYVNKEGHFEFIVPPAIGENEEALEEYNKIMDLCSESYHKLTEILRKKAAEEFVAEGKSEEEAWKLAEKKAIEDARYVLPNACETKIIVTMNTRSLMNFFHHRCCERAQWEIRDLACRMLTLVKEVAPTLFKYAGPVCVSDKCPEGAMSCGKILEKRKIFLGE